MNVSVVIPTLNREDYLLRTIKDLLNDYQESEIVVVDQSDEKLVPENHFINQSDRQRIKHFPVNFKSLVKARNFGWQHALYEKIIFCDDDVIIYPGFTQEHFRALDLEQVGIVAGGIDQEGDSYNPNKKTGCFNKFSAIPIRNYASTVSCYTDLAPGGNFSLHKSVAVAIGGFDETLERGAALYEETEFCLRAKRHGYKLYFNANARLKHLAIPFGGCRVFDPVVYVKNLSRNRSVVIMRYVPFYFYLFALSYLIKIVLAYVLHHRNIKILFAALPCIIEGIVASYHKPFLSKNEF